MATNRTIAFLGAGNMAEAMIRGLLRGSHFAPEQITASGPREERMAELRERFGIRTATDNREAAVADIVVLSIKIISVLPHHTGERISNALSGRCETSRIGGGACVG